MRLNQSGVADTDQLQVGLLHHAGISKNELPDFLVVLKDEVPSGHCASSLLLGTAVDSTEPDEDVLNQAAAIWPLSQRGSGG